MITIKGLNKFFNKGRQNEIHVLNNIGLELPDRGMVAIFGRSGCGKTTLLNVIGGLDKYADGIVNIEGQSIRSDPDGIRNRYMGYIFQNYNLNRDVSCFENVADALRLCGMTDESEIRKRVMAALSNVDMDRYASRTPDTLSGGQQQRIAIARAIVKNPRIILADEPTGNLDEANTVMIMDLLKAISRDHLVLLVTHEANLVDHYCDRVIELSDGKVVSVRDNSSALGYTARDKNDIWLGELSCRESVGEDTHVEYYGDAPQTPVRLRVVNNGGKLYIKIDTEGVQILDQFSEIKLREGIYEEQSRECAADSIDMSELPPVNGTRFGHLFDLKSSMKSGYKANFKDRKKGKRLLRRCMALFASVIVLMSAVFGSSIGDIIKAKDSYNHNVFYVYTPDAQTSAKLNAAVGSAESGIDHLRLSGYYSLGDERVGFRVGSFETFTQNFYESGLETNAVILDTTLSAGMPLVAGKNEGLEESEALITTKMADALLKKSTLGYIEKYDDLIGLVCSTVYIDNRSPRIAGIVECDEPAVYITPMTMAKYVAEQIGLKRAAPASDFGVEVAQGETVLVIRYAEPNVKLPPKDTEIMISGRELKVSELHKVIGNYQEWLKEKNINIKSERGFFEDLLASEHPELEEGTREYDLALERLYEQRYFEYLELYYSHLDEFCRDLYLFEKSNFALWLYVEKGIEVGKFTFASEDFYKATVYKQQNGVYPTSEQLRKVYDSLPYPYMEVDGYLGTYESDFYSQSSAIPYGHFYLVSDADYIALSKQIGDTDPSAQADIYNMYVGDTFPDGGIVEEAVPKERGIEVDMDMNIMTDSFYASNEHYTVIHSRDPELTAAYLEREFADIEPMYEFQHAIVTPSLVFDIIIEYQTEGIVTGLITMAVIAVLMSLCMYFIMRSSLLNRIKEVGIYRAIGVTRRNLIFKFFVEAAVLSALTVLVGYLCTSAFIFVCLSMSSMVADVFFYPIWMAVGVLVLLLGISLFFGVLPILSLLRKTPSEILAKYDI